MKALAAPRRLARFAVACMVPPLAWLCVLARWPTAARGLPPWLSWFGRPGSWPTVVLTAVLLVSVCVLVLRARGDRRPGSATAAVAAGLAATSALLGISAFWDCHDDAHPPFFQPLIWTAALLKGGMTEFSMNGQVCPATTPVALVVAQLAALGAIFTGLSGVALALFRSQVDLLQANHASSVTAVIGVDADSSAMIGGIARTLSRRDTLVVIVDQADEHSAQGARAQGARVLTVDLNDPTSLVALSLWRRLERLYLLSGEPSNNRMWLDAVTGALARAGDPHIRLPLVVRVDDPWQAEAWRNQQLGGAESRWAVDTIGKYEITASWLLDNIIAAKIVRRVFICGTSQLTLALCADLNRRKLERDYYSPPTETELPAFTLVGEDADECHRDQEFHREQFGLTATGPTIDVVPSAPSVPVLERLIQTGDPATSAVIFVDDWKHAPRGAATLGSRLAARFPTMPVYSWDPDSHVSDRPMSLVGRLRTYRLMLEFPDGQAPDAWERAASLIHERYLSTLGPETTPLPSRLPWAELDEFYRGSNRRQVRNALSMVEQIAGHTWNPWGDVPTPLAERDIAGLPPLRQLERMGFDRTSAMEMARAEHQDWCRYYRDNGWRYGLSRDDKHRIHDKLVDWPVVQADPQLLNGVLVGVANTLWSLRQLGYRSHPVWRAYTRAGTVRAEQHDSPWTWTSPSGATMQADAGDWRVHDGGATWSVRNEIFRSSYLHIRNNEWQRCGTVLARRAHPGETIETAEGPTAADDGDWVVKGEAGEQWPVPADVFALHYVAVPTQ
ncbi:hypothetical protein MHIB_14300 [Mycolicibacter hiberniae]|uniref:RyR domain protein n=2 Tax=Mycolicibacter hiberniae TaxID=29314 RepID=A0A7I7X0R8_9MYCO|nr:hypothetical protein MHIB_14300 [Mycolicibacter hiberniae]